jgi:hypothetical protein
MRGTAVTSPHASPVVAAYARIESAWVAGAHRLQARGDRGEGVISAAIVVLIMAAIGAAMWLAFNTMWKGIQGRTEDKVEQIGDG